MVCFLMVLLHEQLLCPPIEGEGHIVFAADPLGIIFVYDTFTYFR